MNCQLSEVRVQAPSRLHFGMFSFGGSGTQYGGAGLMLQAPRVELRIDRGVELTVQGPARERVHRVVEAWMRFHDLDEPPPVGIRVEQLPRQHAGLGSGTQLALSVVAGLEAMCFDRQPAPRELAMACGRGRRSAVGTYGFGRGGLIVEAGKQSHEELASLDFHHPFPDHWRVLLLRPRAEQGLHGSAETLAFQDLPAVTAATRQALTDEVRKHLVPAVVAEDFDHFSASVYRFNRLAGQCFAGRQGGPFNGPRLTRLVAELRELGIQGVGQSSWGPTIFAFLPDQAAADDRFAQLTGDAAFGDLEIQMTHANNSGASIGALRHPSTSTAQ